MSVKIFRRLCARRWCSTVHPVCRSRHASQPSLRKRLTIARRHVRGCYLQVYQDPQAPGTEVRSRSSASSLHPTEPGRCMHRPESQLGQHQHVHVSTFSRLELLEARTRRPARSWITRHQGFLQAQTYLRAHSRVSFRQFQCPCAIEPISNVKLLDLEDERRCARSACMSPPDGPGSYPPLLRDGGGGAISGGRGQAGSRR